jgi:hypothetical protein
MRSYDDAWEKVSSRFWKHRRREFLLNILLFLSFHLFAALFLTSLPYTQFHVGYYIAGVYVGWVSMPSITYVWGTFLLIHLLILLTIGATERLFRLRVEREILRDYIEEEGSEKPKRYLWQPEDEVIEYAEENRGEQRKLSR